MMPNRKQAIPAEMGLNSLNSDVNSILNKQENCSSKNLLSLAKNMA